MFLGDSFVTKTNSKAGRLKRINGIGECLIIITRILLLEALKAGTEHPVSARDANQGVDVRAEDLVLLQHDGDLVRHVLVDVKN